jgi:hypothetical protein
MDGFSADAKNISLVLSIGTDFLISNIRPVLNVVYFLLGNFPASEFYMPTLRNTLSVPFSQAGSYEE